MFSIFDSLEKNCDLLVLPLWQGERVFHPAAEALVKAGDFAGKEGELVALYPKAGPKRLLLVGLGDKKSVTVEKLRRAYGGVTRWCQQKKITQLHLVLPKAAVDALQGVCEGLLLGNYAFETLKSSAAKSVLLEKIFIFNASAKQLQAAERYAVIQEGSALARDLINGNADDVTPAYLAHVAQELAKQEKKLTATVFSPQQIKKLGLGLLLAVNRGSAQEPAFFYLAYKGDPHSKEHTVLVGKGMTYDTGGLCIKPPDGMVTMKRDMSGAAAVMATVWVAAKLGLKVNVTGVVASAENCVDAKSFKPGDVYRSYLGKTVEVINTDAEGRLILADALAYANAQLKPTRLIDIATLTGGIVIALGNHRAGLFSNDDKLAAALAHAGEKVYEPLWRLPLQEELKEKLKSSVADMVNSADRAGTSTIAALFIQEFVGKTPWAHLDIAGTALTPKGHAYLPPGPSGFGVRLLVELLSQ